jgi:hypothetical protein
MQSVPSKVFLKLTVACVCLTASAAHAEDWTYKFSGFGTLAAVHSTEDRADYTGTQAQPEGAGYSHNWDFGNDSKLGGQFDVGYGKQWSAAVQVIAERRYDNSYDPELALGFVKWKPGYGLDFRVGRVPYSMYLVSDYRKIGYAQPWARPPLEMYFLSGNYVDGGDVTWRTTVGDVAFRSQFVVGGYDEKISGGSEIKARESYTLNLTADIGSLTLRGSYMTIQSLTAINPRVDSLFLALRYGLPGGALFPGSPPIPGNPAEADKFSMTDSTASYMTLGATYDPGSWFVTAELGRISQVGFTAETDEGYVTAGMRIKAFTPYATYAKVSPGSLPTATHPVAKGAITQFNIKGQESMSAGLRWDFYKNIAVKAQYDHVENDKGARGTLTNLQPGFVSGGSYDVVTFSTDFVF